jgi:hypothetical protein
MADGEAPVATDHTHVATFRALSLPLDELASIQPGVARLMLEVSNRFSRGYHAAKAENAQLARFQLNEGLKILRICGVVQPKYAEPVAQFTEMHVDPIRELLAEKKWSELDAAWEAMTKEVNRWHAEFAHGFLVWKVSDTPPADLDLTPQE